MENKKLERIIEIIREQMIANAPGTSGGFSSSADPKGPVAGFDSLIKFKKKKYIKLPPGSRKRWTNPEK